MSAPVIIRTKSQAELDERREMQLNAPKVTTTERTDYEACLERFRDVCMRVRELTGINDFRGGYDEWRALAEDENWSHNETLLHYSTLCNAINLETNYEAGKLGIVSPNWWKECWAHELTSAVV